MRVTGKRRSTEILEGDMTPMIDMTFQLIAFFMVLINFTDAEQSEKIKLPSSELAQPPEGPMVEPITLQVTKTATVLFGGKIFDIDGLKPALLRQKQFLEHSSPDGGGFRKATIIIRADGRAKTGDVQKVIKICQDTGFDKFALRAKQQQPTASGRS